MHGLGCKIANLWALGAERKYGFLVCMVWAERNPCPYVQAQWESKVKATKIGTRVHKQQNDQKQFEKDKAASVIANKATTLQITLVQVAGLFAVRRAVRSLPACKYITRVPHSEVVICVASWWCLVGGTAAPLQSLAGPYIELGISWYTCLSAGPLLHFSSAPAQLQPRLRKLHHMRSFLTARRSYSCAAHSLTSLALVK